MCHDPVTRYWKWDNECNYDGLESIIGNIVFTQHCLDKCVFKISFINSWDI